MSYDHDDHGDPRKVKVYLNFFKGQRGGNFPVYSGAPYQYGTGFGSFLSGLFRNLFPIVAPIVGNVAKSFVTSMSANREAGASFGEAAKRSIAPSIDSALRGAADAISQKGTGRKRRAAPNKKTPPGRKTAPRKRPTLKRKAKTSLYKAPAKKRRTITKVINF